MRDELVEELWDALPAESRQEIADAIGTNTDDVGNRLAWIRRPENAKEWGWTVPHAEKGHGEGHVFRAVLWDDDVPLTAEERLGVLKGARSTASSLATMGENQVQAIRTVARTTSGTDAARLHRYARALDGAAAMAEEARDVMVKLIG